MPGLTRGAALVLAVVSAGIAGCVRRAPPSPAASAHYLVGPGYQLDGVWHYPREDFHLDETGLASVLPDRGGPTADGEAWDGDAMVAAHRTLQLPAVVRVTNLDTGLQARVRVIDRGPANAGRVIGLSRRAASVLGVGPGGAARVRVQVDEADSLRLRDQLGAGPAVRISTAPRVAVTAEALPPPGGARAAGGVPARAAAVPEAAEKAVENVPERLPAEATRVAVAPGRLVLRAGSFGRMDYARALAARLAGLAARVQRDGTGRSERFDVVAGPFADLAEADAALDRALRAGVSDARIVVE